MHLKQKIIIGNWKMYKTPDEAKVFFQEFLPLMTAIKQHVGFAVPYIDLSLCTALVHNTSVQIGAQNLYFEKEGAYTGEISPSMLKACGARFVLIGHSERRTLFKEDDAMIAKKVKAALHENLTPLLCVGENLEEREKGITHKVIVRQLTTALDGVKEFDSLMIAYEPTWAIGTGKPASSQIAQEVHEQIRSFLKNSFDTPFSKKISLLYGGSVKAENIVDYLKQKDIDGVLVGGASLNPLDFAKLCKAYF